MWKFSWSCHSVVWMLDRHVNRIVDRNLKCSCSPLEKGWVLSIKFQWDESFEHSTAQLRVYWVKLWGAVVPRPLAGWWRQTVEAGATGSTSASARRKASSGACQGKGRALFVQRSRRDIDQQVVEGCFFFNGLFSVGHFGNNWLLFIPESLGGCAGLGPWLA